MQISPACNAFIIIFSKDSIPHSHIHINLIKHKGKLSPIKENHTKLFFLDISGNSNKLATYWLSESDNWACNFKPVSCRCFS